MGNCTIQQNRLSLSFINYPNRYRGIYDETGIKEDDRFARLSLWRYWNDKHRFSYGTNIEYNWRRLTGDNITKGLIERNYAVIFDE